MRDVCSTMLSLRKAEGLRGAPAARPRRSSPRPTPSCSRPHIDIIRDELNVKEVELTDDVDRSGSKELQPQPRRRSARASAARTQEVIKALKAGDWTHRRRRRRRGRRGRARSPRSSRSGMVVAPARCGRRRSRATSGSSCSTPTVTPELEREGLARDLIRAVQQARRERRSRRQSDRIRLAVDGAGRRGRRLRGASRARRRARRWRRRATAVEGRRRAGARDHRRDRALIATLESGVRSAWRYIRDGQPAKKAPASHRRRPRRPQLPSTGAATQSPPRRPPVTRPEQAPRKRAPVSSAVSHEVSPGPPRRASEADRVDAAKTSAKVDRQGACQDGAGQEGAGQERPPRRPRQACAIGTRQGRRRSQRDRQGRVAPPARRATASTAARSPSSARTASPTRRTSTSSS